MNDKISKSVEPFQEFLNDNFKQCSKESIEVLLMLAYGHMFDIFTPNQLIQTLGIDKNKVYSAINSWSIYHLRKLFLLTVSPCWIPRNKKADRRCSYKKSSNSFQNENYSLC